MHLPGLTGIWLAAERGRDDAVPEHLLLPERLLAALDGASAREAAAHAVAAARYVDAIAGPA
jgi:hypothetical protein